jgi:hypothetical protein
LKGANSVKKRILTTTGCQNRGNRKIRCKLQKGKSATGEMPAKIGKKATVQTTAGMLQKQQDNSNIRD